MNRLDQHDLLLLLQLKLLKGNFKQRVEEKISTCPSLSLAYASMTGKRFELGEPAILKAFSPYFAVNYSLFVLKHRWPEAEKQEWGKQDAYRWNRYKEYWKEKGEVF